MLGFEPCARPDTPGSIPGRSILVGSSLFLFSFLLGNLSFVPSIFVLYTRCCDLMLTTTLSSSTSSLLTTRVRLAGTNTTLPKIKFIPGYRAGAKWPRNEAQSLTSTLMKGLCSDRGSYCFGKTTPGPCHSAHLGHHLRSALTSLHPSRLRPLHHPLLLSPVAPYQMDDNDGCPRYRPKGSAVIEIRMRSPWWCGECSLI